MFFQQEKRTSQGREILLATASKIFLTDFPLNLLYLESHPTRMIPTGQASAARMFASWSPSDICTVTMPFF